MHAITTMSPVLKLVSLLHLQSFLPQHFLAAGLVVFLVGIKSPLLLLYMKKHERKDF